ncbi:MAG: hypothetical protein JWP40_561 [Blastococcus sp.]|nr:hypothetical protein [Blastococcus sp.]
MTTTVWGTTVADHNDPNSVNSIFSDVDVSAADVYDMFGYPSDATDEEKVVLALTFAAVPEAGVFDTDMLYRLQVNPHARSVRPGTDEWSLSALSRYFDAMRDHYLGQRHAAEIRVTVDSSGTATVRFSDFPGGSFTTRVHTNEVTSIRAPSGAEITAYLGGRDDAFFNDLTGFFRSINYAPQFYHVPMARQDLRELPIPKTLLELEGNSLFNYNPEIPEHGHGVKLDLPPGPYTWEGDSFAKDADGNYRFVYSGMDAQAGKNVNAIILEVPLSFLTERPEEERVVNVWGESWVLKASSKIETIPDDPLWLENPVALLRRRGLDDELQRYKLVDTVGQPFADAGLSEREDSRQLGANNFWLAPAFVRRLAHLGWGFGPSVTALGLASAFDHDNSPVSVHKKYATAAAAFPRGRKLIFQELRMPDDSWNKNRLDIPLRRPFEIFIPNVCAIDVDTTGTWPFGRRPEDQVATRFLSMFLDMGAPLGTSGYSVETLGDQALWDGAKITPRTPPNPLHNDTPFLTEFPYLAPAW